MTDDLTFSVTYKGRSVDLSFGPDATLASLSQAMEEAFSVEPKTVRLALPKRGLPIVPSKQPNALLSSAGQFWFEPEITAFCVYLATSSRWVLNKVC